MLYQAKDQHQLNRLVFGLYVTPNYAGSELMVGGYDRGKYRCSHTWFPVISNPDGFWQIGLESVYVADRNNPPPVVGTCVDNCVAIFSTESLAIYGPAGHIEALAAQLGATYDPYWRLYRVDCANRRTLRRVMFQFTGGKKFGLDSQEYVLQVDENNCFLLFIADQYDDKWFFGIAWNMRYYMVFDKDNNQVGIAPEQ